MPIKLEKMTKSDYEGYAGAEINDIYFPDAFINWEVPLLGFDNFWGTCVVILDINGLYVDMYNEERNQFQAWYKECSLSVAADILEKSEKISSEWLSEHEFWNVGIMVKNHHSCKN